jgi:hypothetical protein
MTVSEQIASDLTAKIARRYQYFSNPEKESIKAMIAEELRPYVPEPQMGLSFENLEANNLQSKLILSLLQQRGCIGATNGELAKIALKYTSRISDLRNCGFKIKAQCETGRTFRYRLVEA